MGWAFFVGRMGSYRSDGRIFRRNWMAYLVGIGWALFVGGTSDAAMERPIILTIFN